MNFESACTLERAWGTEGEGGSTSFAHSLVVCVDSMYAKSLILSYTPISCAHVIVGAVAAVR